MDFIPFFVFIAGFACIHLGRRLEARLWVRKAKEREGVYTRKEHGGSLYWVVDDSDKATKERLRSLLED